LKNNKAEKNYLAQLEPRVKSWLYGPEEEIDDDDSDEAFDRWLLKLKSQNHIFTVGKVMIDRALLETRFSCVPERCSPAGQRGKNRSCCADVYVYLTPKERARIKKHRNYLRDYLNPREPRLKRLLLESKNFWLDNDGDSFCRPGKRCVFSQIDKSKRIRCHLHPISKKLKIDQTDIQPIPCRLFPLVIVDMEDKNILVTVLNRKNYRAFGAKHPKYYPCLNDDNLPPLIKSMGPTLDWVFGKGFAKAIEKVYPY
jgi:Fe-S-cluster containining protein